jgi:ParB-like chromosome segregation protein Spo0J
MSKRLEKIYKLRKHPDNPRLIKDAKFFSLRNSIEQFPEMLEKRPIIVNQDMLILGGNMRLRAAEDLGMKEIWIDQADWTEEKQKEFIIKDNTNSGDWDFSVLANEWNEKELTDWGLDIPTPLEFQEEKEEKQKCECCGK